MTSSSSSALARPTRTNPSPRYSELGSCATCGDAEHLGAFSPSAGGVVCAGCEAGSFPLDENAHRFLVEALARPLAEAPDASERSLAQADRAVAVTLQHPAHGRLRRVA